MISLIISFILTSAISATSGFDENGIVLSMGVISDIHIDYKYKSPEAKFRSALQQLNAEASKNDADGLDAVLVAGDLTQSPYRDTTLYIEAERYRQVYESVFDPHRVPMIYAVGNHDVHKHWNDRPFHFGKILQQKLGPGYFERDLDNDMLDRFQCRHCLVGACHIICLTPQSASPVTYPEEVKHWLDITLHEITSRNPEQYVLLLTHPMIENTVYGSRLGNFWATSDLTPILSKYPQVMAFGGHLHFPLNDPRSIWQGDFTVMGDGSVRYMAIEDGGYEYMAGKTTMKDMNEFSQGLLLQMDASGNVRITRMDFYNKAEIGSPWILAHPSGDRSHLKPYSHEKRSSVNKRPKLSAYRLIQKQEGVILEFASGTDDEFIHHYVITVTERDSVIVCKKLLSDFYKHPQTKDMKSEWELNLGKIPVGKYKVNLQAVDSWGKSCSKTANLDVRAL